METLLADLNRSQYILQTQLAHLPFNPRDSREFGDRIGATTTIGEYSVLFQLATSCTVLHDRVDELFNDRQKQHRVIELLVECGPKGIYPSIDGFYAFVQYNRSYYASYHHCNNRDLFTQMARLHVHVCPDLRANLVRPMTRADRRRVKVGFVSSLLLKTHSVAKDRLGIIKALSEDERFDVRIMTSECETDAFFDEVVGVDKRIVCRLSERLSTARRQIADEQFDILVYPEVGMCQRTRLIAFARLAPVQIATWGHSDTTGLPEIDYFVSSVYFDDEEDATMHYSERLLRLGSLGTYYYNLVERSRPSIRCDELDDTVDALADQLGIRTPTVYGCLQTYFKLHPTFIAIVRTILQRDAHGVVLLLVHDHRADVVDYLRRHALPLDRLIILDPLPYGAFCHAISRCDVVLDYYPFGGFNSTLDSLALGKVVITKSGPRISGKLTSGLYRKMGIDEFVCATVDEYTQKAVYYATHKEARLPFEQLIRDRLSLVFEDRDSITDWAEMLLGLKRDGRPSETSLATVNTTRPTH
jgi:predicted O-linked N-acetylglucosamine transferase (SPINDLY family)